MSTLTTSIQHCTGALARAIRQEKEKRHTHCKVRSKTISICRLHDLIYRKNPKESIKNLLEPINEFSNVEGYTINTKNSIVFQYN